MPDDGAAGGDAPPDGGGDGLIGGRFRRGERLGGGLTGDVFEAEDTESGEKVALKLVDPAVFPTPLLLQRTERELKQLERLEAPGIARIYAHGRENERLWIASELLGGGNLHEMVAAQGPLALERATEIVLAIGRALGESAKAGVIHRDLAPKNVIIDGSEIKLINFGVPMPEQHGVQGVPEFVSPEQVAGKPVDQRSNIYSLGAIYYFLLTAEPPFTGEPAAVFEMHRSGEVAPPSAKSQVSPAIDQVVLKALEKSSSKRFMTLRQALEQVETAAGGGAEASSTQPMGRAGGKTGKKKKAAKTMMGGFKVGDVLDKDEQPEPRTTTPMDQAQTDHAVQSAARVDEAMGGGGNGQPAADAQPQSQPQPQPTPSGSAPTEPADSLPAAASEQPAPAQPAQPSVPQAASVPSAQPSGQGKGKGKGKGKSAETSQKSGKSKGKFRETMWFKKGALDAAAAEQAASQQDGLAMDKADAMPIEDRYNDDGTLSSQDQQSFSLRTGHTQAMAAMKDDVPRDAKSDVSEDELIGEMKAGRGKFILLIGLAVVILAGVVIFFATR